MLVLFKHKFVFFDFEVFDNPFGNLQEEVEVIHNTVVDPIEAVCPFNYVLELVLKSGGLLLRHRVDQGADGYIFFGGRGHQLF